jgi:hypothetical protein
MKYLLILMFIIISAGNLFAQSVPASDENIPFLVTFGNDSKQSWGDDDFFQIFFCVIPSSQTAPVYIRVFDPDTGGDLDEKKGEFNTVVRFSVFGGLGCWSDSTAQSIYPAHTSGSSYVLSAMSFGAGLEYDKKWYTFGPFNPSEGEYVEKLGGRVFKIIAEGLSGDDGNLFRYFLSTNPSENIAVEGGNLFTYKYHFRLSDNQNQISQIYPFADDKTISIEVANFDWDNDGFIRILTVAKNGIVCPVSGENNWSKNVFPLEEAEKNSTLEIQFIKNQKVQIKNNNVVVTVRNQYGVSLPFFVIPIGGIPVYSPKIQMK